MRGRKPIPEAVRRLRGNQGGRSIAQQPGDTQGPVCPDWLAPSASAEWYRVVPLLTEVGIVGRVDAAALAVYCQTYSQWQDVAKIIRRDGYVTDAGRPHPLLRVQNALTNTLRQYCAEFGFTPSSRTRIEIAPPPNQEVDEFAAFQIEGEIQQ